MQTDVFKSHRSFILELTLRYCLSFTVLLLLLGGLSYFSLRRVLYENLDQGLQVIGRSEADFASKGQHLHLHPTANVNPGSDTHTLPRYVQIVNPEGQILAVNFAHQTAPLPLELKRLHSNNKQAQYLTVHYQKADFRQLYLPFSYQNQVYFLIVVSPLRPLQSTLDSVFNAYFWLSTLLLCLAGIMGWLLAHDAVKPLHRITLTAQAIGVGQLSERIPIAPDTPREFAELTAVLNQMLARLENAVQNLKQFSADASHELKTPLSVLKGELQVALRRERNPQEYQALLNSNLEEVNRLIALTEGLLALSRWEQEEPQKGESNLQALFKELQARYADLAQKQKIDLKIEVPEKNLHCPVARLYLSQILSNLLDNALRFSQAQQTVWLRAGETKEQVWIQVQDQGPGIAPDEQKKIFERFYQIEASRSENRSHFGIGLSLSKAITEAHQGQIKVVSSPRQGACFEVRFPKS
ncbi:hypothetical protein COW36_07440 [bacterium (Candidatus Blackallbacteria) CG17_big_fil_post_rev_8_21_14_2_50_48_46]|uniref:histidine kinase n=1 Tax=bacterium (Candidatus Blackallbacteria) CG17_big_fil_post_rev_8_21_14_2_50_48_46 TaxID=2014261 RepID=A0A2M7G6Z7_9BACT|nr:MAG: hypothetical protein COW64_16540 [bacterium (Candidatus Blackallbacteria) CG18_big_fil_WC_8_21_14_2_50_49_26]PIW17769.1 MAG: hypothetical protein COW36_07440 [bacterium (Candidatus Blackallbacteria) CG17_big_fil_post_rev_8_21_14_2_50_48_46]PIW47328.1 MAG: hypothetical protein COW20_12965 [bacterium (Candidatus Blackallbacteria) CG13_big_fil_rev_8_21_14_2_50_49_14]